MRKVLPLALIPSLGLLLLARGGESSDIKSEKEKVLQVVKLHHRAKALVLRLQ